ncbi:MAG: CapA family protein, partial [Minisyncoccia bacterium]
MSFVKKEKIKLIVGAVFSVTVGISLASLLLSIIQNKRIVVETNAGPMVLEPVSGDVLSANVNQPQYFYINKDTSGTPKISAKAYLVGDLNTGEVILAKNQDERFPIASTSKLMTALVTSEISAPGDTAQVTKSALSTEGTNGELRAGEKIKTSELLYPLLLESSNDAAEVLAQYFGRDSFVAKMNQEAANLQMSDTSYEDPSGLSKNNQSTVSDLFKLAGYLVAQKPDLVKITTERSYATKSHSWSNISQFLHDSGYIGGKSGYTDLAKQTVVSLFDLPLGQTGLRPISITLLQSTDRHKDVETILKYLKKNVYYGGEEDAMTDWVKEKVGSPDIKEPNFVTMAFGGDIMLDRGVKNSVVKNFGNDYSAIFEKLDVFKNSDIAFANLEGTASDQGVDQKNLYSFRMNPEVIPALAGSGVSILSVANNHIGDWGRPAFTDTLSRLKENEILYTGGGSNYAEAETPTVIEKNDIKIGFLAFSDKGPDYMKASADEPGILLANDPDFDAIIQNAAKQVDDLVVSFHFGEEYQTTHNARQEELVHRAIDDGAKLIIGSHPHVVEDTEVYKNGY